MTSRLISEHLQVTGAFKARGALNFARLNEADHYTSYSSGNHGQAVAWAARCLRRRCTIFVPCDVNPNKRAAMLAYGAELVEAGYTVDDRKEACESFTRADGATIIPPFDHPDVIAGQGSLMIEVLEQLPNFDAAFVPVGGGGLISGCAIVLSTLRPKIKLYAAEPEANPKTQRSLRTGKPVEVPFPQTIADGLRHRRLSELAWRILEDRLAGAFTCREDRIRSATVLLATRLKQVVEPSGAVSLACLAQYRDRFRGQKVVVVLSGGNSDLGHYQDP